ncbi:N-acetyltransferase family protein [Clostridium sp. JNZ J1-5]
MIIREYKKEDLRSVAKVHVDTWNSTYENIFPEEYLKNRTYDNQLKKWIERLSNSATNEFMFVAENEDGQVIGFSTGSLSNKNCTFDRTIYTLYILKEYQKMGIGKLLVKAVASKLKKLGAKDMILSAFGENNACNFYQHIGGKQVDKRVTNLAGLELVEVSYAWNDINYLISL